VVLHILNISLIVKSSQFLHTRSIHCVIYLFKRIRFHHLNLFIFQHIHTIYCERWFTRCYSPNRIGNPEYSCWCWICPIDPTSIIVIRFFVRFFYIFLVGLSIFLFCFSYVLRCISQFLIRLCNVRTL